MSVFCLFESTHRPSVAVHPLFPLLPLYFLSMHGFLRWRARSKATASCRDKEAKDIKGSKEAQRGLHSDPKETTTQQNSQGGTDRIRHTLTHALANSYCATKPTPVLLCILCVLCVLCVLCILNFLLVLPLLLSAFPSGQAKQARYRVRYFAPVARKMRPIPIVLAGQGCGPGTS